MLRAICSDAVSYVANLLRNVDNPVNVPKRGSKISINDLHEAHPEIRAKDWRSPLIRRLLESPKYKDGSRDVADSFRSPSAVTPIEQNLTLYWADLKKDFDQTVKTYQASVITELATLGLACILVTTRAGHQITEVTRRGEKADYWLDDKGLLLEVSGQQSGSLDNLCSEKANQLRKNPFGKAGYVCVANFDERSARLWYYDAPKKA
jgi:hypothetical protein